jgi:phosphoribosylglycinamide formyltransferase-1
MSAKRTAPLRVAVLASGRGSNLQVIIDSIEANRVQATIVAVISNKKDAVALERATKHGLKDLSGCAEESY